MRTCGRLTTCCQKVPPSTAVCPARTTPRPRQPRLDVAAAHHHRRPGAGRLLRRRFGDGAQQGTGLFDRRQHIGAQPGHISSAGRQSRLNRSSMPVVPAFDESTASSPDSFAASQSLIMVMVAALR